MKKKLKLWIGILWATQVPWLADYANPMWRIELTSPRNKKNWVKYR